MRQVFIIVNECPRVFSNKTKLFDYLMNKYGTRHYYKTGDKIVICNETNDEFVIMSQSYFNKVMTDHKDQCLRLISLIPAPNSYLYTCIVNEN